MPAKRPAIPTVVRNAVLDEYSHRCAVCGGDRPHLHHINEKPKDNDQMNLLPLCPNCHLRDQHNPTRRVDAAKLRIFRLHKDPSILKPGFHPIFLRQAFLEHIEPGEASTTEIEDQAKELINFVKVLEMGEFYGGKLKELSFPPSRPRIYFLGSGVSTPSYEREERQENQDYRQRLIASRYEMQQLFVEMLRYQGWANVT